MWGCPLNNGLNSNYKKKLQKYQHYHQAKLIKKNILQANKFYLPVQIKYHKKLNLLIHQFKKAFAKQTKSIKNHGDKQIEAFEKQGENAISHAQWYWSLYQ